MKKGVSKKTQVLIGLGLISLIGSTACVNNQSAASATLPASPAAYPGSEQVSGDLSNSLVAADATNGESEPQKVERKPEPFVLRENETLVDHKVVKGDNLTKLARRYGTEVRRIQAANGLTGDMILTGKVYKIPSTGEVAPPAPPAPAIASTVPKPPPPPVSNPEPPSAPSTFRSPSLGNTYSRTAPPTFAPRDIKYSNSTLAPSSSQTPPVISPTQSASSVTIPLPDTSGSGAAFPSPDLGSGSSF